MVPMRNSGAKAKAAWLSGDWDILVNKWAILPLAI
jgi:hypothetical protein